MAVRAAEDCLRRAGLEASDVGMVVVSSGSTGRRFPGPAAQTVAALGIGGVPAIDLPMASAGSLFGIAMASRLAGSFGRVLAVAAEKMFETGFAEPIDPNVAILLAMARAHV